ncbi:MAG: ligase-associated DNA damage response endonuclease PdeM [Alphaproteobacteria bacterium]|nr:ligase-associated DNA damage response endonuclease PdeM [Alphaproteobacteria bacterium]
MALLSDSGRKKRPPAAQATAPAAAPLAQAPGATIPFTLAGEDVAALADGGLWIESARTLVVSDLHLEKGSSFALRGQMIPPYDTRTALRRVAAMVERLAPDTVVSLGDSFHDRGGPFRMAGDDRAALRALTDRTDWVWIEGNHDPDIPAALGGRAMETLALGPLILRHEPTEGPARGEIAGHLHPCARVAARGRSVRARCFATDGDRLVMPALGAYAGGLNVCDIAFAAVFHRPPTALLMARAQLHPAPPSRLLGDG